MADTERLAATLISNGVPVELKIFPGLSHGLDLERGAVFRRIGEYCRGHIPAATHEWWRDYHSIAQWQAEAPALVWFWIPAAAWIAGWWGWRRRQRWQALQGQSR